MNLHHFSFETVEALLAADTKLKKTYPHVVFLTNKPDKELTVEKTASESLDKKIIKLLETSGGKFIN